MRLERRYNRTGQKVQSHVRGANPVGPAPPTALAGRSGARLHLHQLRHGRATAHLGGQRRDLADNDPRLVHRHVRAPGGEPSAGRISTTKVSNVPAGTVTSSVPVTTTAYGRTLAWASSNSWIRAL
jgi:hypothetical protein